MTPTLAIARRELTALFFSPIAYVVLAVFALVSSLLFLLNFQPGAPAELRWTFFYIVWLMVFLVPGLSMRLIAEDMRSGVIEGLMTAPLSDTQVVVGKWMGAVGFLAVLLAPLLVHLGVLLAFSSPDFGPILTGLLGLVLVGALYLAIGTFVSAATQNQIIAFIVTVLITGTLTIVCELVGNMEALPEWLRTVIFHINVARQYGDFSKGVLDGRSIVYFVTTTALFLFFAVKLLESKRWR